MRAVLRAALAARRSARPTDALSGEGTIFLDFDFTVLAESVGASRAGYHTPSTHRLKADTVPRNCSSFAEIAAAHPPAGRYGRLVLLAPRCAGARGAATKFLDKRSQSGDLAPSNV